MFVDRCLTTKFEVVRNKILFFQRKVFDVSKLDFLTFFGVDQISNVELRFFGKNIYGGNVVEYNDWGYFNLLFIDSGVQNDVVWKIRTV